MHNMIPVDLNATAFRATYDAAAPSREAQQPIVIQPTPTVGQHIPSVPNIPTTIHHTIAENMEYWLEKSYWQYLDRQNISLAALGWNSKLQHRFCAFCYLYYYSSHRNEPHVKRCFFEVIH